MKAAKTGAFGDLDVLNFDAEVVGKLALLPWAA